KKLLEHGNDGEYKQDWDRQTATEQDEVEKAPVTQDLILWSEPDVPDAEQV
ncbi:MAG: hypothetical protein HYY93_09690, partial [Planctomycetes bacterium]|nr:hypothetical protein [Planctomycetota bacterium]